MLETLEVYIVGMPIWGLLIVIALALAAIGKGADLLVEEAVTLSRQMGVSKVLIGATVVSLGTTLPEVTVSVMSAINGNPELALGNAVGSIICDTGLILGLAIFFGRVPIERSLVNRQGYVQLLAGVLLVVCCLPFSHLSSVFQTGGRLPQTLGFVFLALLAGYLWMSVRWASSDAEEPQADTGEKASIAMVSVKIILGLTLVILSSDILIPAVEETARRAHVPDAVIAATLVAFGTSLPELVTAITAVRKGHGELAIGNVIGADILNVLFVAGAAAAVTPLGLVAGPNFFKVLFPAMLLILLLFRVALFASKEALPKWAGFALLGSYGAYLLLSF